MSKKPKEVQSPAAQSAAGQSVAPEKVAAKSGGTVAVACKLPNGMRLRLFRWETIQEPILGGGTRDAKMAQATGDEVVIRGPAVPHGERPSFVTAGGFAITQNVPADFMREWFKQNQELDAVRRGLIYMHESTSNVEGHAREHEKTMSGLEPLDPARLPKGIATADVGDKKAA